MQISEDTKILMLVVVVAIALYMISKNKSAQNGSNEPIHNEGKLSYDPDRTTTYDEADDESNMIPNDLDSNDSSNSSNTTSSNNNSSNLSLNQKMNNKNSAQNGYKDSSYMLGTRGGKSQSLDDFFNSGAPFGNDNYNGFSGKDETGGNFASYVSGNKRKLTDKDKFNASDLLPKESNPDLMDDPQAQVSIKNAHMINIHRPVGVNTIMTSLKNPSHDIRGTPPNPRNFVSPWMMSSYEPDLNIKNRAMCS
jgi:hypothetical protein